MNSRSWVRLGASWKGYKDAKAGLPSNPGQYAEQRLQELYLKGYNDGVNKRK